MQESRFQYDPAGSQVRVDLPDGESRLIDYHYNSREIAQLVTNYDGERVLVHLTPDQIRYGLVATRTRYYVLKLTTGKKFRTHRVRDGADLTGVEFWIESI